MEPPGEAGVVKPKDDSGHLFWVVEITIPPQSCRAFESPVFNIQYTRRVESIVLFVHSGSIEYAVHSETVPPATVKKGHQDDTTTFMTIPSPGFQWDTLVRLNSGDWVTQDRAAWFTYRNPGPGSAVILMAALVVPDDGDSSGGKG